MAGSKAAVILGVVGWIAFLAAVASIGYNAYFFHTPGPEYRYPTATGILLSAILATTAIQLIVNARRWKLSAAGAAASTKTGKCRAFFTYLFAVGLSLEALCYVVFTALGCPWTVLDALVLSAVVLLVALLNLLAIVKAARARHAVSTTDASAELMLSKDGDIAGLGTNAVARPGGMKGCLLTTLRVLNRILKALTLVYFLLMVLGALKQGMGYRTHGGSAPGTFYKVTYPLGTQNIHVWCDGPKESRPVIWIESGGGHTLYDLVGLLYLLRDKGHRACIYDRPGMGLSDYAFPHQDGSFYDNLLRATGEQGPFVLAAWAGGADLVWTYAAKHREQVLAVALMDVYPNNYEFDNWQYVHGKTDAETAQYKAGQLGQRTFLHDLLRLVGVQFGLAGLLAGGPAGNFFPPEYLAAYRFLNLDTEKSWTTQYYALLDTFGVLTNAYNVPVANNTIARDIPLLIMASYTDYQKQCEQQNVALDSERCQEIQRSAKYGWVAREQMASYTDRSQVEKCTDCTLALAVDNQTWVTDTLSSFVHSVALPATA